MARWRTTVSISDRDTDGHLRSLRRRDDVESYAEAVRVAIERSQRLEECEAERQELQRRVDSLRHQLAAANRRNEETQEIVEYVEDEREREQAWDEAPVWRRARWWLLGRDK